MNKRRSERYDTTLLLNIGNSSGGTDRWIEAKVLNVSRSGIAVMTDEELVKGVVYRAEINLHSGGKIKTLISFVRTKERWNGFVYGGTFIGLDESDWAKILVDEVFRR